VPVTADVEAGFGASEAQLAETVTAVLAAGVVGVNLEDAPSDGPGLYDLDVAAGRIRAARAAGVAHGVPELVINARTDVYVRGIGEPDARPAEVLRRGQAFADAGADCLFVPGLTDLELLATLVARSPLPISVLTGPAGPSVAQLRAAGVRRVTTGSALAQAAYTVADRLARELLDAGELSAPSSPWVGYGHLNSLLDVPTAHSAPTTLE
jgi:2-methylisocitrate lyase-like PEP mutase family enzyme